MAEKTEQHWVRHLEAKKEEIKGVIEMSNERFLPLRQYKQSVCGAYSTEELHLKIQQQHLSPESMSSLLWIIHKTHCQLFSKPFLHLNAVPTETCAAGSLKRYTYYENTFSNVCQSQIYNNTRCAPRDSYNQVKQKSEDIANDVDWIILSSPSIFTLMEPHLIFCILYIPYVPLGR